MNVVFHCPKCKNKLSSDYSCSYCSRIYFNETGFFDFINTSPAPIGSPVTKLSDLLSKIYSQGYSEGLKQFLKNNSEFEYRFNEMEGSIAFRVIRKNNVRCLVLNSDLGNISENLSKTFDQVYSLETDKEKILIQKFRFQKNNIDSIVLIRSNVESLPFPDKYFDLVVLDGIKIDKRDDQPLKTKVTEYFKEIKRVLTSDGCLCAGVENKYGLKISGGETNDDLNNEIFSDSFYGYNSFLISMGFKVKPYWVLPSYRKPHYSGNIEDDISLKWFFHNFDKKFSVDTKFKIIGLFLKRLNKITRSVLVKLFCPSFLFYCYNGEIPQILEDIIIENTGFKHCIQNARLTKVMYILLDTFGNPRKILSCKHTKYDLTEKIFPIKRIFPKMKDPDEKIVIEEWLSGEVLDRLNDNDVNITMKWLTDFQKNTMSELLSPQEIEGEVSNLKNELGKIEVMIGLPYDKWLEEYREHISSIKLKKTAVHGDFQVRNILVDRKNSSVNVIDWDWRFQEKGNPVYDFVWLASNIMMLSNNSVEEFRSNLNGTGKAVHAIKIIKETMKKHFQADLDFIILLRFMILRFISIKIRDGTNGYLLYVEILKVISDTNNS